ncbi:MAG: hypothetical protein QW512_03915 [Thermofilaceae archaeon]
MLLALLISSVYVHASDPVSVAYSILQEIEESRTRVDPILVNTNAYAVRTSIYYAGSVVYVPEYYYPQGGGFYRPANVSGLLYTVHGLPLVHFAISLNMSDYWATTVLTMTNEREPDKYIFLRASVDRFATFYVIDLRWGVVRFNGTAWHMIGNYTVLYITGSPNETLQFTVVPCFYEHQGDLIYGFAIRVQHRDRRYTYMATGDIAYTFLQLANRTAADLAQSLLSLYRWYVFVGAGAAYVTRTMIYSDAVITSRTVSSVTVNYTVQDPLVLAIRVNAEKLMELYASGLLPVYDPTRGFIVEQDESAMVQRMGTLMMGLVPLGISLVLGYFMRKFHVSSAITGLIVVCVSSILMYTLFSNIAFIVLLLISSLMIVSLRWGEA